METMSSLKLLLLFFCLSEAYHLPMNDCRTSHIDLLIVFENYASEFCINQENNTEFISGVLDVFLAPGEENLTRLHVAVASFTSSGPVIYIAFQDWSRRDFIENIKKLDRCHSNESPLDMDSVIWDIHTSINISFQESNGNRLNAKDIVIFMYNYTSVYAKIDELYHDFCQLCDYYIFFVIGLDKNDEYLLMIQLLTANSIVVTSISHIADSPGFHHSVCNQCAKGWFSAVRQSDTNETVVCYHLDHYEKFMTSRESVSHCEVGRQASLAAVHSKEDISFLNAGIQAQLQHIHLGESHMIRIRNYFYLYVYMDVSSSQQTLIRDHYSNSDPFYQTIQNWGADYFDRCGAWLLKFSTQSQIFDDNEGKLILQWNRSLKNDLYTQIYIDIPCNQDLSRFAVCQYPSNAKLSISRDHYMVLTEPSEASVNRALNRGEFLRSHQGNLIASISYYYAFWLNILSPSDDSLNVTFDVLFPCYEGNGYRIPYSFVCDHKDDCHNGLDEEICHYRECKISEFKCHSSSRCVKIEAVCDLFSDCEDGSDEQFCTLLYTCVGHVCGLTQCIPQHWVGDGYIDCVGGDETDENNDESISAVSALNQLERCVFLCNRTQCVYPSQLNDGVVDWQGPEGPLDETIGSLEHVGKCRTSNVHRSKVKDWAPLCIYVRDRYGSLLGCRDGSHLQNCSSFTCPEGYTKCPGSYCIPTHYWNNGRPDCLGGEDEGNTNPIPGGYLPCPATYVPVHPDRICDGHNDCSNEEDEINCHVSCASGFTCVAGAVTVGDYDKTIPLTSLDYVDDRTRYLDLSGVDLSSAYIYGRNAQLNNLINAVFVNCNISNVGYEFAAAIGRVSSIYWMNLSYNAIREIPTESIFRQTSNLRVLDLSHNNKLAVLRARVFDGSENLEHLNLSYTSIDSLHHSTFQGLSFLKLRNLSHTMIDSMLGGNFPDSLSIDTLDLRVTMIRYFEINTFDGLTIETNMHTDIFSLCCPNVRGSAIPEHTCHAPSASVSSCTDLIGDQVQRILLWVIGIIALLCNTVVIVYRIMGDTETTRKPYGLFVVNLGISDLLMGVYLIIIAGADAVYSDVYVWNDKEWRYSLTCKIAGFLSTLPSETSMFFIFLVTLDRLLVIKFPVGEHGVSKFGKILLTVVAWLIGLLLSMIPLLPVFNEDNIYTSNALCLGLPQTNNRADGWGFSMGVFIVFNFTIFLIIAVGQFLIYRAMSSHRSTIVQTSARRAQDIEVAKTLFLVVLSDFLCWFPIGVMGLLALAGKDIGRAAYAWSAVLVLPVNSALNPLLYTIPVITAKWEEFKHRSLRETWATNKH